MKIRKFEKYFYEEEETFVFIKDEKDIIEIYLFTDNDLSYKGKAVKNGNIIAEGWNDTIKLYRSFNCTDMTAEKVFNYSLHLNDDDEGEAAEEAFNTAVEGAKNWLNK